MSESSQGSDRHSRRLSDDMVSEPAAEEETPDAKLWDMPGHDGVVTDAETDPDRTDLRAEIGQYVSLAAFPTQARTLIATAEGNNASDRVLAELRQLPPDARFADTEDLWDALGLRSGRRF